MAWAVYQNGAPIAIKRKQVVGIDCAEDYFKWAQGDTSSTIKYIFVSSNDVSKTREQMDGWQQHRVPNIMNVHSIMVQGPYLYTRDRSCYKSCCFDSTTNRFIGNCAGWVRTTARRQTIGMQEDPGPKYRGRERTLYNS